MPPHPDAEATSRPESPAVTMTLSPEVREMLERLALERLNATANDGWSFVTTEGAVNFGYCPWDYEEWNGDVESVRSVWRSERLELIERGDADPNEEELLQWRKAQCRSLADNGCFTWSAFVVPLSVGSGVAGYALFVGCHDRDEVELELEGIFESVEEAKSRLLLRVPLASCEARLSPA